MSRVLPALRLSMNLVNARMVNSTVKEAVKSIRSPDMWIIKDRHSILTY